MKPVKLSFKGLNSFSEQTEIDFTRLTTSGIFGIFGDTGSGKSTILDAINLALYGDVGRSKERTDIINYNCESVEVSFTFNLLHDGARKNYTVERSIKKKNGAHKATLYEEQGGESLCVADNPSTVKQKIVEIVGVDAEDFRKCIALPQGEFAEFVQSKPSDRVNLIERLFNLGKYGARLKDKVREKESETDKEFSRISGELSAYAEVSDEAAQKLTDEIKERKETYARLLTEKQKADEQSAAANALLNDKKQLDEAEKQLNLCKQQSEEMEKLRRSLALLPACKSILDENSHILTNENKIAEAGKNLAEIAKSKTELESKSEQNQKAIAEYNYEERRAVLNEKSAELAASKDKFESLERIRAKMKENRESLTNLSQSKTKADELLKKVEEWLLKFKQSYSQIPAVNIEDLFKTELKGAVLRSEYVNELNFVCELREDIMEYKSDTKLYKFVNAELNRRIDYLDELIKSCANKNIDVNSRVKQIQENSERREALSEKIKSGNEKLSDCKRDCSLLDEKIARINAEGKEQAAEFKRIFGELAEKYGSEPDYNKIDKRLKAELNELDENYKKLVNDKTKYEKQLLECEKSYLSTQSFAASLEGETEERKKTLDNKLKSYSFNTVSECENLIKAYGEYDQAEAKLKDYDERRAANTKIYNRYSGVEGITQITPDKAQALENIKNACEKNLRDEHGKIQVLEHNLQDVCTKLAKKNALLEEADKIAEQKKLVGQLKELIKGNKFMEFVADGHLVEISEIASKTLLDLTDGRYFLVYKDGFFVGDNFNGGGQRGVNTLSGGETFLVSLSLALALSEVICARSNKSIEFFFLDEGFGTLDETLIEVVMTALEKLKSANFTIGIISHVEELKHRIESKITVNKATQTHGSTLAFSC